MKNQTVYYIILAFVFTAITAVISFPLISTYLEDAGHDSRWYVLLAEGRINEVIEPFSSRILHPAIAGWIDAFLPLNIGESFFVLGIISLFLFLILNSLIIRKITPSPLLIIPLIFIPYLIEVSREFFIPDIFYIFLVSIFFFALYHKKEGISLGILFLLFFARESTILLGLVMLAISLIRKKKKLFIGTLIVIAVSMFISAQLAAPSLSNIHNVGGSAYTVLKLSYNFFNNFFGIKLWASTLAGNCEPVLKVALPEWSLFGSIQEAGVCKWNPSAPLHSLAALLTVLA
tara:strand:- start:10515 stop:11381 length:867 start_codon:yes stop_codon:yes gene_type:complete